MNDIINGLPIWVHILILLFGGGVTGKLYATYVSSSHNIREELWERMNALERQVNDQQKAYNDMYAHVIYLESLLIRKGIKFTPLVEKLERYKKQKEHTEYNE